MSVVRTASVWLAEERFMNTNESTPFVGTPGGTNGQRGHHEASGLVIRLPPQLDRARFAFIWKMVSGDFET